MEERDKRILLFVAHQGEIPLKDLEQWISETWGITTTGAWFIVRRLVRGGYLRYRRHRHKIYVELHPDFIAFITQIYSSLFNRQPHRIRYQESKRRHTEEGG